MSATWPRRGVYRPQPGEWFVPSRSTPGAFYRVEWGHGPSAECVCNPRPEAGWPHSPGCRARTGGLRQWFTCSCPAGADRGQMGADTACRHVREAAAAERDDGYEPRPAMRRPPGTIFTD